ncbi:MAG: ABC transporter permease [Chloroflexota bacterium]|nr:ABC transporter permease [Chloroflexota bacterium]
MRDDVPLIDWDWVMGNLDQIWARLVQHVSLTLIAVAIGFAISFGLALLVHRRRVLLGPLSSATATLYTIPSLALFALLWPATGFNSELTATTALVSYTLFILLRNMVAGLDGVPDELRETATALGYTRWQRLWRVELPLALPLIVAGVRVATVTTVGLVTVAAIIGLGGLGALILSGLRSFSTFVTPLYVGAFLSLALALLADVVLLTLQRRLTPWAERRASSRA